VQRVVIKHVPCGCVLDHSWRLLVVASEEKVAEGRHMVELLDYCVHVADAAEVFNANVAKL
jgi:hypothetical protein